MHPVQAHTKAASAHPTRFEFDRLTLFTYARA
jgi:hypothetical protein